MSLKLVNRSPDLSKLRGDGYHIAISESKHLLVRNVPCLTADKKVARGTIVCDLDVAGETTIPPKTHVAFFVGEFPHDFDGKPIPGFTRNSNQALDKDLLPNHQMSRKPTTGSYRDFYEKITTYIAILTGPAQTVDPTATAITNPVVLPEEGETVFTYIDTAASKSGIYLANCKLEPGKIAIVGLGGTGGYVLDLIAKTPIEEIHLFDGDGFFNHNAFRSPGAVSIDELGKKYQKVDYFAAVYSKMRKNIFPHDCFIDASTVELLKEMGFVFLCIDRGAAKRLIIERLEEWSIPFVDCGMGIQLSPSNSLGGIITVTTSTPAKRDDFRSHVALSDGQANNEYSRNVQIADLSALNAALAVIKWKKLRGYYNDLGKEHFAAFNVDMNEMGNEDSHEG